METIKTWVNSTAVEVEGLLASFIITIFLGFIIIPILKKLKVGQIVRDDGPKTHLKKSGTPTMGGIIMLLSILIVSLVVSTKYPNIRPVTYVTLGYGFIGFIDDFIKLVLKNTEGLKPSLKMLGLIVVATAFIVYLTRIDFGTETYIPIVKEYITLPIWVFIPCMVFIILACTNSLNLTDGLDGLASGITAFIMMFFVIVSIKFGNKEMAAFSSIVLGACIGFLFFNMYPARAFMGDTGSLALGGAFCSVAIILKMPLILVVVAGVCVLEAISVMIQVVYFKATHGKRFFKMAPLHHHFEQCGFKETAIVPTFWLAGILLAVLAFLMV